MYSCRDPYVPPSAEPEPGLVYTFRSLLVKLATSSRYWLYGSV